MRLPRTSEMVSIVAMRRFNNLQTYVLLAVVAGYLCGTHPIAGQHDVAKAFITVYLGVLQLLSLPIIFLALSTTIGGMRTISEFAAIGRHVITYTLGTTVVAALIGLGIYVWVHPVQEVSHVAAPHAAAQGGYLDHLVSLVPTHLFAPFMDGNVVGVLLLALAIGLSLLTVPDRDALIKPLSALLGAFLKLIFWVTRAVPLLVWSGVIVSFHDMQQGSMLRELGLYLGCVVGANLLQGGVVLPLLLRLHGIAPWPALRGFAPALSMAFFSKSSVATIPTAMRCAEQNLRIQARVSRFVFPVCTTINMNACAAFILITTLYVSTSHGVSFSTPQMFMWVGIATLAAVGNAGVPMGCYTLTCALLGSMDVPITKMALILPAYSFLDMLETAINVWSDGCVAMLVNRKTPPTVSSEIAI